MRLSLKANRFHGPVDLTKLPQGIQGLNLSNNRFTDFSMLPRSLARFYANDTELSG
eukprot:CAMPEP_0201516878 /NCGR_PEP_ID=MMETSP0161_2-20130828/8113_1 /ASSEMBLY_ACC=CAM_ASM_000251 /TAXON_ID=180227 /ORGANISM="Neoparamoeba aestuarina, Strain SoJaBio B1-5/56/2" /LENGTH=55 /DNA_ID=CAMNT_0047914181 /DNA_START=96 /DNA_END=259 /DNA_ORIENTATION=+